jgi:cob(I)alamin adenosyltransferase
MKNDLGKIHIYTGDGKGKTTAALGLTLRAIGAGYRVYIIQFLKGQDYSELKSLKPLEAVTLKRFGEKNYVLKPGQAKDRQAARQALAWSQKILRSGRFDVVVLDEVFLALFFKLLPVSAVVELLKNKPQNVELILTGRRAPERIIRLADYVTEMKEIKHPYKHGLLARKGIED